MGCCLHHLVLETVDLAFDSGSGSEFDGSDWNETFDCYDGI